MNHANADNLYQYNGKELNGDHGLNWLDFGKRWYDPAIARFLGVDPIADRFPFATTYNYAENEPIANIDLWGLQKFSFKKIKEGYNQGGFKGALKGIFDISSVVSGTGDEATQSRTIGNLNAGSAAINAAKEKMDGFLNSAQEGLKVVGEAGDNFESINTGITALTGGVSSPVTGTGALAGAAIEGGALLGEMGIEKIRDGNVNSKTWTKFGIKLSSFGLGKLLKKAVDGLKIAGSTLKKEHGEQTVKAVRAAGEGVKESLEKVAEEKTKN